MKTTLKFHTVTLQLIVYGCLPCPSRSLSLPLLSTCGTFQITTSIAILIMTVNANANLDKVAKAATTAVVHGQTRDP